MIGHLNATPIALILSSNVSFVAASVFFGFGIKNAKRTPITIITIEISNTLILIAFVLSAAFAA